jgi:hypothetical protein
MRYHQCRDAKCDKGAARNDLGMAGFSDFFEPHALSPEEKRRWFGVVRCLAEQLLIPHDQLLPFAQECLQAFRDFLSIKHPGFSQTALDRVPDQLRKLHKSAHAYTETIMRMPRWLCGAVEGGLPRQPLPGPPHGFVLQPPSSMSDLHEIAERVQDTGRAALSAAHIFEQQFARATKRERGRRPKNQGTDSGFSASDALVWSVLNMAYRRGGTVTVNKTKGGTLDRFFAEAIRLGVWPPDLAPQGLTSSRLYRLHREWHVFRKADTK